jgi:hypothetical protein
MASVKRQPSSVIVFLSAAASVFGLAAFAQGGGITNTDAVRRIEGNTVYSKEAPKVQVSIAKGFRFVGTQQINLYGNAEAEQFVFVKGGRGGTVESFYWLQFEHFLPSNDMTYNYGSLSPSQVGDLQFNCDVRSWPDLTAAFEEDPGSDAAAGARLLAKQNLSFPRKAVLVLVFHLPSADHRTELMIIYGEALPEGSSIPVGKEGVLLDKESPDAARMFLDRARQGLLVSLR